VTVRNALEPLTPAAAAHRDVALRANDSMRDVLAQLLRSPYDTLPVANGDGELIGQIDLQTVRDRLRAPGGMRET
jgi:hypothetical protein